MSTIQRCEKCGANIERVRTPNGGQMICNHAPGFIRPGEGGAVGYEPRGLTRVQGEIVHPLAAHQERISGNMTAVQVWLVHDTWCPKRSPSPAAPVITEPEKQPEPRLF